MSEKVICLYLRAGTCVDVAQYDAIKRGIEARHLAGATEPGDGILAQLLLDSAMRRHELREE